MSSEKAEVPGVMCLSIVLMGLIILRFKRKLIYFGARLTRGERSFFVAQKSGSVISKGNHFAQLHLGGELG